MKKCAQKILALCCSLFVTVSCTNEADFMSVGNEKNPFNQMECEVSVASPIDVERLKESSDSIFEVPVNVKVFRNGKEVKSVVEEVIPTNAVLTHRRGNCQLFFASFWGTMLADIWTLTASVNYSYGQWVSGHTGADTGYAPSGSVDEKRVQKAIHEQYSESSGKFTFKTSAYYPLCTYQGQVSPDCNKWYPFHYNTLKIYYTWIDGNN